MNLCLVHVINLAGFCLAMHFIIIVIILVVVAIVYLLHALVEVFDGVYPSQESQDDHELPSQLDHLLRVARVDRLVQLLLDEVVGIGEKNCSEQVIAAAGKQEQVNDYAETNE